MQYIYIASHRKEYEMGKHGKQLTCADPPEKLQKYRVF